MKRELQRNGDHQGLHPCIGLDGSGCSFVDEVNGRDSQLLTDFIPTRQEIEVIAAHWANVRLDLELFYWEFQTTGSTEWRMMEFANRRLHRARQILGDESYDRVWQQVECEAQQSLGSDVWQSFCEWRKSVAK